MGYIITKNDTAFLIHHGIKGQKWGIRRYQNEDGSLTPAGRRRYGLMFSNMHKKADDISDVLVKRENNKVRRDQNLDGSYSHKQMINDLDEVRKELAHLLGEDSPWLGRPTWDIEESFEYKNGKDYVKVWITDPKTGISATSMKEINKYRNDDEILEARRYKAYEKTGIKSGKPSDYIINRQKYAGTRKTKVYSTAY